MNPDDELRRIRDRIDEIDDRLLSLISERASCAAEVAAVKQAAGKELDCYRAEREAEVLRRLESGNPGPLSGEEVVRLFREIMSACLALEEPLRVAFLGPQGTFTQAAALKHFGHSVQTLPLDVIDQVFRDVASGKAHYGVVPVENSTEGIVHHTLDMFMGSSLHICGEVELRIHHHLMGTGPLDQVTRVYAHQQSLAQCRNWLATRLAHAATVSVSSNGEAARRAAQESGTAALAGEAAADMYGLDILAANVEDDPDNTTRFLVIGRQRVAPSGHDKTSLMVSARNRPGALFRLLEPLARHGISMTRIESRPSHQGMWDYVFFFDFEGHVDDPNVAAALAELDSEATLLKVLGSYPAAVL